MFSPGTNLCKCECDNIANEEMAKAMRSPSHPIPVSIKQDIAREMPIKRITDLDEIFILITPVN